MTLVMGMLGGCEKFCQQIKNRPIRRRLRTGSPEVDADIATYRQAVTLMKGLPAGDGRKWENQAGIHGTSAGGFNLCQHGSGGITQAHLFFPWHRAYLFYFEKICQELTGNKNFGLPYWNWNQNPGLNPAFLDQTSSLFVTRSHTTVAGNSAFSTATLDTIFADTNYFTFSSQIEGTPHNTAHGWIGGIMGGGGSAADPVFWTHHNMADYCWAKWNIDLGNDTTNDQAWANTSWNYFVDAQGNAATSTAGLTTLMPLLSYQFESSAIGSAAARDEATGEDFKKLEKRIRDGADIKFDIKKRIPIAERTSLRVAKPLLRPTKLAAGDVALLINSNKEQERIFASIQFAQLPPASDFFVRVFVNMPSADINTSTDDPHYAGSFAFFGTHIEGAHHEDHPQFLVNITDTLQKLKQRQELSDTKPVSINLVAVPMAERLEKPDAEIILEKLEIIITPVIVKAG
jgi:tyrosinase